LDSDNALHLERASFILARLYFKVVFVFDFWSIAVIDWNLGLHVAGNSLKPAPRPSL
jgi:hypothetical protein